MPTNSGFAAGFRLQASGFRNEAGYAPVKPWPQGAGGKAAGRADIRKAMPVWVFRAVSASLKSWQGAGFADAHPPLAAHGAVL